VAALAIGLFAGAATGFFGGYRFASREQPRRERPSEQRVYVEIAPHNPRKGPAAAKVTIVEFGDFQCRHCRRASATLKEVLEQYGDAVALVYKHQPLESHAHAMAAAIALQAAQRQGNPWPMHDKMFENRKALTGDDLRSYAEQVGLDVDRFTADVEDPKLKKEVLQDQEIARSVGATRTPTFFINGKRLRGARKVDSFAAIIDAELEEADKLLAGGTPIERVYELRTRAR